MSNEYRELANEIIRDGLNKTDEYCRRVDEGIGVEAGQLDDMVVVVGHATYLKGIYATEADFAMHRRLRSAQVTSLPVDDHLH